MKRKYISYWKKYEDPTAMIRHYGSSYKLKKSVELCLAERIAKRSTVYFDGRLDDKNFTLCQRKIGCHCLETVNDLQVFVKTYAKSNERHLVTSAIATAVIKALTDPDNDLACHLQPRESRYVGFLNGFFDMCSGKFKKMLPNSGAYPGYQRFEIQSNFLKPNCCNTKLEDLAIMTGASIEGLLRPLGALLSGYPVQRCLLWCNQTRIADLLQLILMSLLPQAGAVIRLNVTDATPDFQSVAKRDCHAILVHFRSAKELTTTAWKKLQVLAKAQKPTLIIASFNPFMAHDADPDGLLKECLYLIPAAPKATEFANNLQTKPDWLAVLASESVRFLHELINAIEPDTAPNIDELLTRPDPNDIPAMIEAFLKEKTEDTPYETCIIPLKEFCNTLAVYVENAGGDPKRVTPNGVGKFLGDLGVNKKTVKLPGSKSKVMALIKRRWIGQSQSNMKGGANHAD